MQGKLVVLGLLLPYIIIKSSLPLFKSFPHNGPPNSLAYGPIRKAHNTNRPIQQPSSSSRVLFQPPNLPSSAKNPTFLFPRRTPPPWISTPLPFPPSPTTTTTARATTSPCPTTTSPTIPTATAPAPGTPPPPPSLHPLLPSTPIYRHSVVDCLQENLHRRAREGDDIRFVDF